MSDWPERHDVFSVPFTTIVILTIVRSHQEAHGRDDDIRLGDLSEQRFLRTLGIRALVLVERSHIDSNIDWPVSGPYYREAGTLYRVARQYEDSQHAFFSTITPTARSRWVFILGESSYYSPLGSVTTVLPSTITRTAIVWPSICC